MVPCISGLINCLITKKIAAAHRAQADALEIEAQQMRDAEAADPGVIRRALDERLQQGQEPTKAAVREAVANVISLAGRGSAEPQT
jgi:hypothetical protein